MLLFEMLRAAVSGQQLTDSQRSRFDAEKIIGLFKLADKHDIGHLLAFGLKQNGLGFGLDADIERRVFTAVYRYEQMKYDYDALCAALEDANIPFMPLKGSVLRGYYPEEWMRTSCDIDILVKESDLGRAVELLVDKQGYTTDEKTAHDISLFSPSGIHVELHYDLIEDGRIKRSAEVLAGVWNSALLREGYSYWYEMTDEMFYFYHIAHMAKHFEEGGCGIRSFVDLWVLDNIDGADKARREELLLRGGLLQFADSVRELSRVWFDGVEHTELTRQTEIYIIHGGIYGTDENRIAVQQHRKGGKLRYALSRIFIPYDEIKFHYEILEKHRWLTPIMEVRRWGKLIFCGHLKQSANELKYSQQLSEEKLDQTKTLLKNIGL